MFGKKQLLVIGIVCGCLLGGVKVQAEEAEYQNTEMNAQGVVRFGNIGDGNRNTYSETEVGGRITVTREDEIAAIYVEFDRMPQQWTVSNPETGVSVICGENAFLHEFVDVEEQFGTGQKSLVLDFVEGTVIADIYVFSSGELPSWVQKWEPPCEKADLLLVSSHSDDEQLFFAGILPYYAGERALKVQVAYVIQHFEVNGVKNHQRPHEQLDGLWTVGVRNYPVMSDFPDLYAESKDRETAFAQASAVFESAGVTYDDFVSYLTKCFRRFKPLVVVSHDLDGEYGHGTHVMCARALTEAIACAADETKYADSAVQYGCWEIEKLYLHLYEENAVVMDFDVPLERFDGKTAFEVSQEGFGCHKSQHWTWFYKWMYGTEDKPITKATDIRSYSPCQYGLYYTRVGADEIGGDFFENVRTYEEREAEELRLAEEAARAQAEAEEALRAAEEQKRLEEQLAMEVAKAEAEAEAAMLAAQKAAEKAQKKRLGVIGFTAGLFIVTVMVVILVRHRGHKRGQKSD